MTNTSYSRFDRVQDLQTLKGKIVNVINKASEQAKVFENFKEEQQIITAKSIPFAVYRKLAFITLAVMFMIISLGGGKIIPLLVLGAGLVTYIVSWFKGNAARFLSYALMIGGMVTVFGMLNMQIGTFIVLLLIYLLIVGAEIGIAALINAKRSRNNVGIREHNAQNQIAYDQVAQEFDYLQNDLYQFATAIDFPPDFLSIEAVEYFIDAIRNQRADSYKELVNLYIDEMRHRAQVEHWQIQEAELASIRGELEVNNALTRDNNAQLRRLNAMTAASIVLNACHAANIQNSIDRNTGAVNRNTGALNRNTYSVDQNTDALNRNTDELHRFRKGY